MDLNASDLLDLTSRSAEGPNGQYDGGGASFISVVAAYIPLGGPSKNFKWLTTVLAVMAFSAGLPLNMATIYIFYRRRKLRNLVNYVLVLDCICHILLCCVCIPIHVKFVWFPTGPGGPSSASFVTVALSILQQVVGNFVNLCGLFLACSIALLRYRRLCWKKRDKFSTWNAIKWSLLSGSVAIGFTAAQIAFSILQQPAMETLALFLTKIAVILIAFVLICTCYLRISRRIWTSGREWPSVLYSFKKRPRRFHFRAMFSSCFQIVLIAATLSPYIYQETMSTFGVYQEQQQYSDSSSNNTSPTTSAADQVPTSCQFQPVEMCSSNQDIHMIKLGPVYSAEQGHNPRESPASEAGVGENELLQWIRHWASAMSHYFCIAFPLTDDRLLAITINYVFLILGSPLAYIASCQRYREAFKRLISCQGGRSPPPSPTFRRRPFCRHSHNEPILMNRPGTPPPSRAHRVSSLSLHQRRTLLLNARRGTEFQLPLNGFLYNAHHLSLSHPNLSVAALGPCEGSKWIKMDKMFPTKFRDGAPTSGGIAHKNRGEAPEGANRLLVTSAAAAARANSSGSVSPLSLLMDSSSENVLLPPSSSVESSGKSSPRYPQCPLAYSVSQSSSTSSGRSSSTSSNTSATTTNSGQLTKQVSLSSTPGTTTNSLLLSNQASLDSAFIIATPPSHLTGVRNMMEHFSTFTEIVVSGNGKQLGELV